MADSRAEAAHDWTEWDNTVEEGKRMFTNSSPPVKASPASNTAVAEGAGYPCMRGTVPHASTAGEVVPAVPGSWQWCQYESRRPPSPFSSRSPSLLSHSRGAGWAQVAPALPDTRVAAVWTGAAGTRASPRHWVSKCLFLQHLPSAEPFQLSLPAPPRWQILQECTEPKSLGFCLSFQFYFWASWIKEAKEMHGFMGF